MDAVQEVPKGPRKTLGQELREIARILVISFIIVVPVRLFIAQPFIVRGASMEPNFEDGEYLIIDELSYRIRTPSRGETVVFRYPGDPRQFFIKRIIGLPGETIVIESGKVFVQKTPEKTPELLEERYLGPQSATYPDSSFILGSDEYFVLGDNRSNSSDSRIWGLLESRFLIGRALVRLWPLTHLGTL